MILLRRINLICTLIRKMMDLEGDVRYMILWNLASFIQKEMSRKSKLNWKLRIRYSIMKDDTWKLILWIFNNQSKGVDQKLEDEWWYAPGSDFNFLLVNKPLPLLTWVIIDLDSETRILGNDPYHGSFTERKRPFWFVVVVISLGQLFNLSLPSI